VKLPGATHPLYVMIVALSGSIVTY
jgi:hypothetical protein